MGSVQVCSSLEQGDKTQRNLRRQLGMEKGFGYTLMWWVIYSCLGLFYGFFCIWLWRVFCNCIPVLFSAICFLRCCTYVWSVFKVNSDSTKKLEERCCLLAPVTSRTGLGAAELLPSAKRGCPGRCISKDTPQWDLSDMWVHPEVPTFAWRAKACRRLHSR